jgi:hypothetical protein
MNTNFTLFFQLQLQRKMISSLSWLPKGAAKPEPAVADPPSKEEIDEIINSGVLDPR